jgi:hypothetical protein
MPFFEKRKRKNDENRSIWAMLMPILALALIGAGLALFTVGDMTKSAESSVNQTNRIGLFVGHHATEFERGAVCNDGLTERSINGNVADSLVADLTEQGYTVDLFYDFDSALRGYRADLLLVLHTRECIEDSLSGYRVINANNLDTLGQCLSAYETATDLEHLVNPSYMQWYSQFTTIAESTPVLLIEMGMLEADRELLTTESYRVVEGLANTLTCFSPLQDSIEE